MAFDGSAPVDATPEGSIGADLTPEGLTPEGSVPEVTAEGEAFAEVERLEIASEVLSVVNGQTVVKIVSWSLTVVVTTETTPVVIAHLLPRQEVTVIMVLEMTDSVTTLGLPVAVSEDLVFSHSSSTQEVTVISVPEVSVSVTIDSLIKEELSLVIDDGSSKEELSVVTNEVSNREELSVTADDVSSKEELWVDDSAAEVELSVVELRLV